MDDDVDGREPATGDAAPAMIRPRGAGSAGRARRPVAKEAAGVEAAAAAETRPALAAVGSVDVLTAEEIAGWAWDPERPAEPIDIEVVDDSGGVVVAIRADLYRSDLEARGYGDGRHGFTVRHIGALLPNVYQHVKVRRAGDRRELSGSPKWVANIGGALEASGRNLIEELATAAILSAAKADQLEDLLRLFIGCARRLIHQQEILLAVVDRARPNAPMPGTLQAIREEFPVVTLPAAEHPVVSVIIPVYNNFRVTYGCIASIARNLPETPFELLVVDDGSSDETVLAGLILPDSVRIERLRSNGGFTAACNHGADAAKGEFLLFLNNDTLVQPGWLDELVKTFERSDGIGIAGAQLLFEDGKIQETGGIVWRTGNAWNWGRGSDPNDPRFRYMRDADYVSGAALMIRRQLFLSLDGFDPYYAPAYYEDTDLAFRVREQAGKRVVVQPASRIIHTEGVTAGRDPAAAGVKRYQAINQAKFYKRWRTVLQRHRMDGENPLQEAERAVLLRAYFIDDCVPTPDMDAGSNAALQHMLALIALGYKVTFLPADNMARADRYTAELEKYGIECPHSPFCASVEQLLREQRPPPNLVYIHRFANAEKYAGMVRVYFPRTKIIYSVADLHFLRMEREAAVTGESEVAAAAQVMRRRELAVMQEATAVIAHSRYEADLLKRSAPGINAQVLGWAVPVRKLEMPIERRTGIAFVGGYQHRPNVDAAVHLADDIMPLVRAARLPIRCYIGGSRMPQEVADLAEADIEIVGFVPDLAVLFGKVRCTVAPLRYGAGVKGKVLDSLAFGLPCVMTEIAAEGIELPDDLGWLVAGSSEEVAEKILTLHRDDRLAMRLSDAGRAFIADRYSFERIKDGLRQIIIGVDRPQPTELAAN
jgi:O-antigen biosynthesis protein